MNRQHLPERAVSEALKVSSSRKGIEAATDCCRISLETQETAHCIRQSNALRTIVPQRQIQLIQIVEHLNR